MESTYPTIVAHCLFKLGQINGHQKISYTLMSKVCGVLDLGRIALWLISASTQNLPQGIAELMQAYLKYGQTFKVSNHCAGAKSKPCLIAIIMSLPLYQVEGYDF
jgi:hypothetical protein